ncbi:MAG: DUF3971 domain-containing protein [Planctomycetaceae bacterium]|nr:DUF3971 domain-containing protein [Planctomycetaceae bacterium]
MLLIISAAAGGVYVLYQVNSQLRAHILNELQQAFPELNIDIQKAQLEDQKGIIIKKLVCHSNDPAIQKKRPLLTADEIYLECSVSLQRLYDKKVNIRRVIIRNPIIRLTRTQNGVFDELKHFKFTNPKNNQDIPIEIINGTILYNDNTSPNTQPIKLTNISLLITQSDNLAKNSNDTQITPLEDSSEAQVVNNNLNRWHFNGSINGDFIRQINIEGNIDLGSFDWEVSGSCRQLDWTPELFDLLPQDLQSSINHDHKKFTNTFQGRFDFGFSATSAIDSPLGLRFAIDGILSQGRVEIHEVNRTLSELNTKFQITDDSIVIEKLTGLGEAARIIFSYSQQGLLNKRSAFIVTNIQGLIFDTKLISGLFPLLSENLRDTISKFDYSGSANLDTELIWQNGKWNPRRLNLEFNELNLTYYSAPYRLDRLRGDLRIDSNAIMQINLTGQSNDTLKVRIKGKYQNVFIDPVGQVQIQCEDIPIDEKLIGIIPYKERQTIITLNPTGKINANVVLTHPPDNLPMNKYIEVGMNKINVCYDKFPYPLHEITGLLRLDGDVWTFENIVGGNESARISGNGFLRPVSINDGGDNESIYEFQLYVQAAELPVDGQLPAALLNESQRELLKSLRAKGKVNLSANIFYRSHNNPDKNHFNLTFKTEPCAGLSIQPTRFPYRIENLRGELLYDNDKVTSKLLTGTNFDGMKMSSSLMCRFDSDGKWVMRLDSVDVERVSVNRELLDALPVDLKSSIESLQIMHPVSLKGLLELSKDGVSHPLRAVWDTYIVLHQNRANLGLPVNNIFGGVKLTGYSEDDLVRLAGEVQFDSIMVNGFQINDVRGPFFYDGLVKQFYVGLPAQKVLPSPPDTPQFQYFRRSLWFTGSGQAVPIVGRLFDGRLTCEGVVAVSNGISYSFNTNLFDTDVGKMARELLPGTQKISGMMNCSTQFWGTGRKMETMSGRGRIELRNANIYEAPVMLRVLRELSIKPSDPKAGAFDKSDIDYTIKGNRLFFNPISFEGSLFSLTGNGEMRIDSREVNLTMKTRLGNRRTHVPVISDVFSWAGDQIIQLNVQGKISDPTVHRILLPAPDIRNAINDNRR